MNSVPVVEPMLRDLRYALRMLRKTPGFTSMALVTLAVAIGVNTAVFGVVNALLLRPLPYPDAGRLATIRVSAHGSHGDPDEDSTVDGATFLAVRDHATTVDAAVRGSGGGVNLIVQDQAANVVQSRVSAGYFGVLGVRPFIGREFNADEDRPGGAPVAVLSHQLWSRLFRSDPAAVGRTIMVRGEPYTVVGVMPEGFADAGPPSTWLPTAAELWTPVRPSTSGEGGGPNYSFAARLRPGATWAEAGAEVHQLTAPVMARQEGSAAARPDCSLIPLQTGSTSGFRQGLLMLWGAAGVVLLVACVNVAGLLLARSGARTREIATRMALGSGRAAVMRQLLVESAVLALLGGAAGMGLGWAVLHTLTALSTGVFDVAYPVTLDLRVAIATLALAVVTSLVFGLIPSLHASRASVLHSLTRTGTRSAAGSGGWPRRMLVVGQVAMGVVLLVCAGLLVRTFVQLKSLPPGFDPSGVVTATISLQDARYADPARMVQLFDATLGGIRQSPGVQAAGVGLGLPYTRLLNLGFNLWESGDPSKQQIANVTYITPGYFAALRVVVARGRDFSPVDRADSPPVAIVNEEFARRFGGGADAVLGRHVRVIVRGERREIVGIAGNTRTTQSGVEGYRDPLVTQPIIYVPAAQLTPGVVKLVHTWFSPSWVVRGSGPAEETGRVLRDALTAADRLLPIARLERMSDVQARSLAVQRFMMALVAGLGGVALLLAAIGVYGLIGSSVGERTRELGIRLALGATAGQVMLEVVRPGVTLAALGVGIGAAAAVPAARLMQSYIWGITPTDPLTFAAIVAGLLATALVASVIPARRVLRLDPALTLRAE